MRHVESNITFRPFKSVEEADGVASQNKKFHGELWVQPKRAGIHPEEWGRGGVRHQRNGHGVPGAPRT